MNRFSAFLFWPFGLTIFGCAALKLFGIRDGVRLLLIVMPLVFLELMYDRMFYGDRISTREGESSKDLNDTE